MNASHFVKGFIYFMFVAIIVGCATTRQAPEFLDISRIKLVPETEIIVIKTEDLISKKQLDCMQANLYFEAGNQKSDKALAAVGYVTLNRSERDGMSVCDIVKEKRFVRGRWRCQFSWHCDRKSDKPKLTLTVRYKVKVGKKMVTHTKVVPNIPEQVAWDRAGRIALDVMTKRIDNPIGTATMYHATYVKPRWDYTKLSTVKRIETHIFYIEKAF